MTDLTSLLTDIATRNQTYLWVAFLVFLRIGAVIALMPAFGEHSVPQRVKLAAAIAFTAIVAPAVANDVIPLEGRVFMPLLTEVTAGLVIGFGLRMFILTLLIAGTIIAQSTSLSQMFSGAGTEPQPAMGNLFVVAGLALAVMAGLHVRAAELMILSYEMMPPGQLALGADVATWGLAQITRGFALAFSLAAPFVIASVIYNVALGVINRAMPQLMVVFVGAPALTLGGLALLTLTTPLLLGVWVRALNDFLSAPFAITP